MKSNDACGAPQGHKYVTSIDIAVRGEYPFGLPIPKTVMDALCDSIKQHMAAYGVRNVGISTAQGPIR